MIFNVVIFELKVIFYGQNSCLDRKEKIPKHVQLIKLRLLIDTNLAGET